MKKELLIISFYFPPEMGAASNRIYQMAEGLKSNFSVTVLTPLPNYPEGKIFNNYKGMFRHKSIEKGIKTNRLWLFPSKSKNKIIRLISMMSYSISLIIYFIFNSIPNTVIIQSPPLLVAFTSVFFLKSTKRRIVLNVSDLWPDAGLELGALTPNRFYKILKKIEAYNYQHSQLVLGQSNEILSHVNAISQNPELMLYRNFPKIKKPLPITKRTKRKAKIQLVYAGLLGIAQGIVSLCKNLEYEDLEFHIYGSGPEVINLLKYIENNPSIPIFYHGTLNREVLHERLISYDIAIIPLVKRIYGSVPSKIFELSALGLPLLYFGGGEGEDIVRQNQLGWVVSPNNFERLNEVLRNDIKTYLFSDQSDVIKDLSIKKFDFEIQLKLLKKALS